MAGVAETGCVPALGDCLARTGYCLFEEHSISSIAELLELLPDVYKKGKTVWFRGHANHEWHLEPSLSRRGKLGSELQLIKQFKQNAFQFLERPPENEWEWIFLMQHYAIPTRLLDWTDSALIGLYFALLDCPGNGRKPAAALWCMYPQKLNEISGIVLNPPDDIPAFGDEVELNDYLPSQVQLGNSKKNPLAIVAPRKFARVYAQRGVFTILHRQTVRINELKDDKGKQDHLVKIKIPRAAVHKVRKELALLGIAKLTVFPQLENVAEQIMEGWS